MEQTRATKAGILHHLKQLNFYPLSVIDVGVQHGTPELYEAFPESLHILIEPVAEQEPRLKKICEQLKHATYVIAAAAATTGEANLEISRNFEYSGMTSGSAAQDSDTHFNRTVPTIALDDISAQADIPEPALLKIDVDGKELEVLKGATHFLKKVECVIIEATLFDQIHDVIGFLTTQNFVLYDIIDPLYRPLDGALWQVDLVFVPKESKLRENKEYADAETLKKLEVG